MTPLRIALDTKRNTLTFRLREESGEAIAWQPRPATIDIGEAGRLLGVEIELAETPKLAAPWRSPVPPPGEFDSATATLYLALEAATDDLARSAKAVAHAGLDRDGHLASVEIPRRGDGFEISYPSGNQ